MHRADSSPTFSGNKPLSRSGSSGILKGKILNEKGDVEGLDYTSTVEEYFLSVGGGRGYEDVISYVAGLTESVLHCGKGPLGYPSNEKACQALFVRNNRTVTFCSVLLAYKLTQPSTF